MDPAVHRLPAVRCAGAVLLAAIFTLACLTTCVGLINSISQYFSTLFESSPTASGCW